MKSIRVEIIVNKIFMLEIEIGFVIINLGVDKLWLRDDFIWG